MTIMMLQNKKYGKWMNAPIFFKCKSFLINIICKKKTTSLFVFLSAFMTEKDILLLHIRIKYFNTLILLAIYIYMKKYRLPKYRLILIMQLN